jgi:hypothetical protein
MSTISQRKPSKVLIFLVLVILVVTYAGYDYWNEKREESIKEVASLILDWKADQVSELEWLVGPEKMKLKRTSEGWSFESPIQEKADSEAVATFIEGLVLEKSSAVVKETADIDWKIFGLDQPKAKIEVVNNLGEKKEFLISGKKNFQGDTYFRLGTENRVLLASSSWQQKAEKKVFDFRDRRWARISPADVEEISVQTGQQKFQLQKKENTWIAVGNEKLILDQNRVRKLLTDLSNNQVQDFESKMDSKPVTEIVLKLKDGRRWTGEFAVNRDKKHVLRVSDLKLTMEIASQNGDEINKLSLDSFRDRREPFKFKIVDVKHVELLLSGKSWKLSLDKDKWTPEAGSAGSFVNSEHLNAALTKMSSLEVGEFLGKPLTSIAAGLQKVVLRDAESKTLLELELRGPFNRAQYGLEKSVFFAKSNQVSYPFTIDEAQWTGLDWMGTVNEPVKDSGAEAKTEKQEK